MTYEAPAAIDQACEAMTRWLQELPEWPNHPTNKSGSVSSHFGPTILSEHDCVLHFARHLNAAGVPWEDLHLEVSPGQWLFELPPSGWRPPKRIDVVITPRDTLVQAPLPVAPGEYPFEGVVEFALASNYWKFGQGGASATRAKVDQDVGKVADYLQGGLARSGYVIIVEECDHGFPAAYAARAEEESGVRVRFLRGWR